MKIFSLMEYGLEIINHLPRINDFIKYKDIKYYVKLVRFNFDSEKIEAILCKKSL